MTNTVTVLPTLPQFPAGYNFIQGVKKRLSELSKGKKRLKGEFPGPQFFRLLIAKNTCQTIDTFEVEKGTYQVNQSGKISANLYDILSGKFEFSVYENQSCPSPVLRPLDYDSSYYADLKLLNYLPEHEDHDPLYLYNLNRARALRKTSHKWLEKKQKPCFFKAMFKRNGDFLNANFLVKVNSFTNIEKNNVKGFSIRVYSLGHKEHELSYYEDGTTEIKRNVHI